MKFNDLENDGMSLRDYFAAKAMQTLLTSYRFDKDGKAARHCYEIADIMLEVRGDPRRDDEDRRSESHKDCEPKKKELHSVRDNAWEWRDSK